MDAKPDEASQDVYNKLNTAGSGQHTGTLCFSAEESEKNAMANPDHLAMLKQGVEVWNQWRREHPDILPNFGGTHFEGTYLDAVNLGRAHLDGAHLQGAYLGGADLHSAYLFGANLAGANLSRADLYIADLSRADLQGANLARANLSQANLREATIGYTTFGDVDLSGVKGLETIIHRGPSTIGIDTIYASHGDIPEPFLKGAGVRESFITYMRSLVIQPIDYYTCFLSYSSNDQEFANRLYADLQREKVRCWFAPEDMKIGDEIRVRIDESIRVYDKLLVVLSEHSVQSAWVEDEVEAALEKERLARARGERQAVLFPIQLDEAIKDVTAGWPAKIHRTRHIGDFTHWKNHDEYQKAFTRLLRDLKAEIQR